MQSTGHRKIENDTKQCETHIPLSDYFLEHGLSRIAYDKISAEIRSGDINVNILIECDENDLNVMAKKYNFTFLQKKAFIKVVHSLKLEMGRCEPQFIHTYVSQQEQLILNQIKELSKILTKYAVKHDQIKKTNCNMIKLSILKLENYKKLLIQCINDEINKLVQKV